MRSARLFLANRNELHELHLRTLRRPWNGRLQRQPGDEKNDHKWIRRYTHIKRSKGASPLSTVGWGDTLYIGLHGRAAFYGVGAYVRYYDGKNEVHNVSGMDLAKELIDSGLPNTWVDLRLWTCYGAAGANSPAVATDAPTAGYGNDARSFAAKVHAAFKIFGYNEVTVTGYKEEVSVSGMALDRNQGKKNLAGQRTVRRDRHRQAEVQLIWSRARAVSYSCLSRATISATDGTSSIKPTPWPAPQISRQALAVPSPKLIFDLSDSGKASGSSPALMIDFFR